MEHLLIKNENDYRAFVQKHIDEYVLDIYFTRTPFGSFEDLEQVFGIEFPDMAGNFPSDWEDYIERFPEQDGAEVDFANFRVNSSFEYPCILVYEFDKDFDRIGTIVTKVLYDIPLTPVFEELEGNSKCRTYF